MLKHLFVLLLVMISLNSFGFLYPQESPLKKAEESGHILSQRTLALKYLLKKNRYQKYSEKIKQGLTQRVAYLKENPNIILPKMNFENQHFAFDYGHWNDYETWPNFKIVYGLCQGVTLSLRQFHYFARFKPDEVVDPALSEEIYLNAIDKIIDNKIATFPGIKDLATLSAFSKKIKSKLQNLIVHYWATYSLIEGGLSYSQIPPLEDETIDSLYKEIKNFLDRNFEPRIIWRWGNKRQVHVIRVRSLKPMQANHCFNLNYVETDGLESDLKLCPLRDRVRLAKNEWYFFSKFSEELNSI